MPPLLNDFQDRLAQKAYFRSVAGIRDVTKALLYDQILEKNGIATTMKMCMQDFHTDFILL